MPAIRNGILMVLAHGSARCHRRGQGQGEALAAEIMREGQALGIETDRPRRPKRPTPTCRRKKKKAEVELPVKHVHFSTSSSSEMNQQILSQDERSMPSCRASPARAKLEQEEQPQGGVRTYDLSSQERIVRGRMPTMEIINERFARNIRIGLFNFIRKSPEIAIGGIKGAEVQRLPARDRGADQLQHRQRPLRGSGLIVLRPDAGVRGDRRAVRRRRQVPHPHRGPRFSPTEQRIIRAWSR